MDLTALPTRAERIRASVAGGVLFAVFVGLGFRLYEIQVKEHERWRSIAEKQQRPIREVAAYRGEIRTADGAVLAGSVRVRSAFAEPVHMGKVAKGREEPVTPEDIAEAARAIAGALGYDREREARLCERLSNPEVAHFCWIERRMDDARAAALERARIRGVHFRDEYRRDYPCGPLAAHVVGLTALEPDGDLRGASAVEAMFDKDLQGVPGLREIVRDGIGGALLLPGRLELAPEDGATVILTIDSNIQRFCEEAAARAAAEWTPEGIAIVVLRPQDGRVLALASWPGYDPREPGAIPAGAQRFRPLQDTIEPGSIMKPLIASFAIERGAISPAQVFDCSSPARFGRRIVRDVHSHGALPFSEVIAQSSNVGMVRIAMALGPEGIVEALDRCGFGRKTGLGFPGEQAGATTPLSRWSYHSTISVAQGYEVAVTPIQMASAFAALGNGGVRMRPQIVERVEDAQGRVVRRFEPAEAGRLVSERVAREVMLPALAKVVEEGTGKKARLEKWNICGKTGTAMKVVGRHGYQPGHYRASFICLAPAEDPKICVFVMTDEPTPKGGTPYGGTVSAPVAKEILEKTLPYLRVPPSPKAEGENENRRE
jgi:cell division protein FtsI (penicillin-binding protein 3)